MRHATLPSAAGKFSRIRTLRATMGQSLSCSVACGLVGAMCAGAGIAGRVSVHLQRAEDGAVVRGSAREAVVIITSPRGIGSASIISPDARWPRRMVIGFRYATDRPFLRLESCRVTTGERSWQTALGHADTLKARAQGRDLSASGSTTRPVRRSNEMMAVYLPDTLLAAATDTIRVSWVDMFRH